MTQNLDGIELEHKQKVSKLINNVVFTAHTHTYHAGYVLTVFLLHQQKATK